jgi:predicted nucleic acid-binding protein
MRIFVDANILVSVLNKEYPLFTHSARILSLSRTRNFEIYTSPICLAIAFYFAEKKHKTKIAREKIALLCEHIFIAPATVNVVQETLNNKKVNDLEDGFEYYSATGSNCGFIVTEDVKDFYFSEIPVLTAKDFFEKYIVKKKAP